MKRNHLSGFTLLELLVSIGIIAILVGMCFPLVSAARARSRSAECMNNLTQIGWALTQYASGGDDWLPTGAPSDAATHMLRNQSAPVGLGLLVPNYIGPDEGSIGVLCCPANNWTSMRRIKDQWEKREETGATYIYRAKSGDSALKLYKAKPTLVLDYQESSAGVNAFNHRSSVQVLQKDGHVQILAGTEDSYVGDGSPLAWDRIFLDIDNKLRP